MSDLGGTDCGNCPKISTAYAAKRDEVPGGRVLLLLTPFWYVFLDKRNGTLYEGKSEREADRENDYLRQSRSSEARLGRGSIAQRLAVLVHLKRRLVLQRLAVQRLDHPIDRNHPGPA